MSKSKLGPIPDDHFDDKDPAPAGTYPGDWSPEQQARFEERKRKLKEEIDKPKQD